MANIIIAYHSGFGHTEVVAQKVAEGVTAAGSQVTVLNVEKITDADWAALENADGIIFGSPTYMGNVSGPFKVFADATSKPWFGQKWKDKIAAGFTNSGGLSGDKVGTLNAMFTLASQHQMVWVSTGVFPSAYTGDGKGLNRIGGWTGLMTQASNDPASETNPPAEDQLTAVEFGKRVAVATQRWVKGK